MHLLLARSAGLDDAAPAAAVDLGQTPGEVVALSFTDTDLAALAAAWEGDRDRLPTLRLANLRDLRHPMSVDLHVETVIAKAKVVLVRLLGGLDWWRYGLEQVAETCRAQGIVLAAVPGDDRPDPRLADLSTVPAEDLARVEGWFREGGAANLRSLLAWAGGRSDWKAPRPVPAAGRWSAGRWRGESRGAPRALVVFYRSLVLAADTAPIDALCGALAARGLDVAAVFVRSLKDADAMAVVRAEIARARPAVVLNATAFSARTGDATVLDAADRPVLQVVLPGMSEAAWTASARGLGASDLAMQVVLPEGDGRILTRAISFKAEAAADPALEFTRSVHRPHPDRIAFVADLAVAWARLATTPPAERRIAMVLSDYPGRGGRAGHAVGLDTPASVAAMAADLAAEGYAVPATLDGQAVMRVLTSTVTGVLTGGADADVARLSLAAYRAARAGWPAAAVARQDAAWGPPSDDFAFPIVRAGNLVAALQPDRGRDPDRKATYHDPDLPPTHAYAAFHVWLRTFDPHALVQVGTHGTLEWLPGKAAALSAACWPEILLGPLPVIYPFIVNNPGEAGPAKRRIGAVVLGHLTPPLARAGLAGAAAELEGLIDEYGAAESLDPRRAEMLRAAILAGAVDGGLSDECGITADMDPADALVRLDAWLCDIKDMAIRDGLHVFGRVTPGSGLADALCAAAPDLAPDHVAARVAASGPAERAAFLAALDGRRVAPGPAGAPTRGRIDVLPTGRNLTTVDPRGVPTRTAWTLGRRAADAVIERHLQEAGDWPRRLVIDMWASAALRTGGDDFAQALALMGVAPVWDAAAARVTGVEAWPADVLGRPRVDVTLRISGLFRDVFVEQIRLFDLAVRTVADLDEPDDLNPLAAARRAGADLWRIFGAAPGAFGAGAATVVLDADWGRRADIGAAYLATGGWAFDRDGAAVAAPEAFRDRVGRADALVHGQDDRERDLLDGDGVADFVGGFAAAAATLGASPRLYHVDTSDPVAGPKARTLAEELARTVRGRACNPRWIRGQMRHGWRGAAELAQAVDALYAFAATTDAVRAHQFDMVYDAYVEDTDVRGFLLAANPPAAGAIARRLDDAVRRGLWQPRRNSVAMRLAEMMGASS
jgi:cobaltochelatase CobN